jgi:hypothetical protein
MIRRCTNANKGSLLFVLVIGLMRVNRHAVWLVTATRSRDRAIELKAARDEGIAKAAQEVNYYYLLA